MAARVCCSISLKEIQHPSKQAQIQQRRDIFVCVLQEMGADDQPNVCWIIHVCGPSLLIVEDSTMSRIRYTKYKEQIVHIVIARGQGSMAVNQPESEGAAQG